MILVLLKISLNSQKNMCLSLIFIKVAVSGPLPHVISYEIRKIFEYTV